MSEGIPSAIDRAVAIVALIVLSPAFVLIALAIKLTSGSPVLHRASRVGLHGRPFTLYKFRSMGTGTLGPAITAADDPRVTPIGKVLRLTKLDELPQLVNVALGEMAIVGPRPEDPRYVENYTAEQRRLLAVRPGITSPASIHYRHEEAVLAAADDPEDAYLSVVLPTKLAIDLEWMETRSPCSDLWVILRTIVATIQPKSS